MLEVEPAVSGGGVIVCEVTLVTDRGDDVETVGSDEIENVRGR